MSIKRNSFFLAALAGVILPVAACGTGNEGKAVSPNSGNSEQVDKFDMTKPVELSFYSEIDTTASDADFMKEFGQYIQKKYPNVTFKNNSYMAQTKNNLEKSVAAGTNFDLAQMSFIRTSVYLDLKVGSDITDLIKKHKIDLSGVDQIPLNQLKNAGGGQLIGLPYQINSQVLFYNKAIFDKFGVPYPKNGMTWQDVTDIVRKTTRLDGGVQYTGFALQQGAAIFVRSNQLSLEPIDLKTNKVTFGNGEWKKFFDEFLPLYQIQGNQHKSIAQVGNAFFKDQTVAMVLAYPNFYTLLPDTLNWDMVSAPSIKDRPGVAMPPVPSTLVINANSPFRDEAFLVAMEMLSKSIQLERAKNYAFASVLTDPEIQKEIGTGIPELKGKNTAVMQPANMAPSITFTEYTADVVTSLGTAFNTSMDGAKDVNTALREAEEAANKKIEEKIAAKTK
ncbi:extracellular solute-binding protein [Paenibacillus hemerocallicola]|uniref:Extracellular solute-binding protein n=1 Tax=Paenibacillus hemerocallicola TaxID=1172614 RepID=A0A5C4TBU9_9BACL|nr:extracellular solute-binding protein [Paenibacillus hemerocallicola]TNJ66080.1 extracellular solute-binding protein [Paenibacillus hemerocallicola]